MKTQSKNRLLTAVLATGLGFLSLSAAAGQDENQRYQIQQFMKAKQQAKAAEAAKAAELAECRKLLEQNKDAKLAECPILIEQGKGTTEAK
jgi:cell division protein FtsB